MPQIAHPTVIQGNRYYGGIFGQGGIGQAFLNPLVGAAAHALPEMLGFTTPEQEASQFKLDEAKRGEAQRIYSDYMGGRLSQDEAEQGLDRYGYSLKDKAQLQGSVEDEVRNRFAIESAKASGYDPTTHQYGDMGFSSSDNKQEEVPDFQVNKAAPAQPAEKVTGNIGPMNQERDVVGEMIAGTEGVSSGSKQPNLQPFPQPAGGDPNPVKTRPVDSLNLSELQQQGTKYFQQFFQPDDGQGFNFKGLDRGKQQQSQVIANRMLGFSNMMKMYDSKQISAPEDVARVHSMIRTTEKDINQMVDWHNSTTTGDMNKIRAMGGPVTLAMDMKSLSLLTPAYIASLPQQSRGAVEQKVRQITNRLQQLNPFELKMVNQFATGIGDESAKMLMDYQKSMAQTGAMNNQTNLGYYKANQEHAEKTAELYQFKIPNMQLDAQNNFLKVHNDKIKNDIDASKLGIEAAQIRQGYDRIAADLGIANNKNAVDYASMEVALRNQQSRDRVLMTGQVMTALSAEQKRNMDMMIKLHSGLSGAKGIKERVASATALLQDPDEAVRKNASDTLQSIMKNGTADAASLIAQKGVGFGDILRNMGIPIPTGINPTEVVGQQAQMGVSQMMTQADAIVKQYLAAGAAPPVELLNIRDHLKVDPSGSPMLDKDAFKTEEDTQLTSQGSVVPRDQKLVTLMVQQAKSFATVPRFTEWLNWSAGGIKNSNIPEFANQNTAKKFYNKMVEFHGGLNGQRK